jgi:MFS family permease
MPTPPTTALQLKTSQRAQSMFLISAVATAALGGVLFGFDVAIITGAGPFLKKHFELDDLGLGWAFSSLLFGCVAGSMLTGKLADRFGRKAALLFAAALFALTSALTAAAPSFGFFILMRSLGGLAVGAVSIASPLYIAEIAPSRSRGRLGALYQMSVVTGILLSYFTNYCLRNAGPNNWRWMFLSGTLPAIAFLLLLLRAPETPRYLILAGRENEARRILAAIVDPASAALEFTRIQASFAGRGAAFSSLLRPGIRRAVAVSFFLAILVHVSGVNTVIDYAPSIFQAAGWKIDAALFATFLVGITNFVRRSLFHQCLSRCAGADADHDVPGLLRLLHRAGLLDADSGNLPQSHSRHSHDRARPHPVGGKCIRGSAVPTRVPSAGQVRHLWLPRPDGPFAGRFHLVLRTGNQKQNAGSH